MTKKYKLLKDLPGLQVGETYISTENDTHYYPKSKESQPYQANTICYNKEIVENNPDWFEEIKELEEVEKPKPVLTYRNGALVKEPQKETTYGYIVALIEKQVGEAKWDGCDFDFDNLAKQNCFLDYMAIDLALDNILTYNRIYKRIKEIDFENNFVCDFKDINQKKYFVYYNFEIDCKDHEYQSQDQLRYQGLIYMSEEAVDWLLSDEVTTADFRIFIEY